MATAFPSRCPAMTTVCKIYPMQRSVEVIAHASGINPLHVNDVVRLRGTANAAGVH
eukprot:m.146449 g.146449  ORF g.146449 m.146449 type:complete len:56 (+) comp23110_c0_seq1:109-276(+)